MTITDTDRRKTDLVVDLVALATAIGRGELQKASRGEAAAALGRQIAMYLCHVSYGFSLAKVGQLFGREKSTVGHAVRQIEDMRERVRFDDWLTQLEAMLHMSQAVETRNLMAFTGRKGDQPAAFSEARA